VRSLKYLGHLSYSFCSPSASPGGCQAPCSSALLLGGGVGGAGGGCGRGAVGELAPVGAFVVGSGLAGGKDGGSSGVDAGGEQALVLGPGGAVRAWADRRPARGSVLGGHGVAWEVRQAGQARWPRSGEGRSPAG
jgi:hypothetical protein